MYAWDRTGRASRVMPMSSGQQRRSGCSAPLAGSEYGIATGRVEAGKPNPDPGGSQALTHHVPELCSDQDDLQRSGEETDS